MPPGRVRGATQWRRQSARRLAEWSLWLDERPVAPVAHRQVVLTDPKRLRAYFVHDRRRLRLLSRVAVHVPERYEVRVRYAGACASKPRLE